MAARPRVETGAPLADPRPPSAPHDARSTDVRLARLHVRVGLLSLARAELETLAGDGALDVPAMADLAEVRWRTGDLPGAGDAAHAHLASGGRDPIAYVVAAEAYAAQGRTGDAQRMAAEVLARHVDIETLFAGEPQSAVWRAAADASAARIDAGGRDGTAPRDGIGVPRPAGSERGRAAAASPAIAAARLALRAHDPAGVASRLAVALRADMGSVAEDVLEIADAALRDAGRLDAAALLLIRGDALTLLGRGAEAAEAYRASNRALGGGAREETQ